MIALIQNVVALVVPFLCVLTLVVTVHELGHFLVARWLGVDVDRFSIGFGPPLLRWRARSGVEWRISSIPLGGYVKFSGDANASSAVPDADTLAEMKRDIQLERGVGAERGIFHFKPLWVRALVVLAGPAANFLLAMALFALLLGAIGETTLAAKVGSLDPTGPAAKAGFRPGDVITAADGRPITDFGALKEFVVLRSGERIVFTVRRGPQTLQLAASPERRDEQDPIGHTHSSLGYIGIRPSITRADLIRRHYTPVEAVVTGAQRTWSRLDLTLTYLSRMVQGKESGDQLGGPVRIASMASAMAKAGADGGATFGDQLLGATTALIYLAAVFSVGIGFTNLLPIPVLDGGHLLFYAYEAVARRPMAARIQSVGYRVGLALLLGFMLFATWNDLQRLNVFKALGGLFS